MLVEEINCLIIGGSLDVLYVIPVQNALCASLILYSVCKVILILHDLN